MLIREHIDKKLLSRLANFGSYVQGGERGGLSESIYYKRKFVTKIFFSDNAEWSLQNLWKMIFADIKANKNNKLYI